MKYSTMMAIAFCGVLAVAMTGCKYDDDEGVGAAVATDVGTDAGADVGTIADANGDANANAAGQDLDTVNGGANTANAASDLGALQGEDGVPATGLPFDQDPNYARCTDVDFAPVYFGFDASGLAGTEMAKIEAVAAHLKGNPGRVVIIEGNCDERGSNEYNLSLGELRAIAIRDYLVRLGVEAQRIQTKSYGEEKPVVMGQGEGAWSKNRRGEFAVFAHK